MDLVQGQACSLCHHVKAQRLLPLPGRTQQHARLHPVQQPFCNKRKLHRQLGKKGCCAVEGSPAAIAAEPSSSSVASNICQTGIPQSRVWELDFSSRPILDERGKKKWELLICDAQRQFQYSGYFPNNKINSTQLKNALLEILDQPGAEKPAFCRFFRGQMQTIISRALAELDIKPLPSRRCFTLMGWLEQRLEQVYSQDPGYSSKAQTLFTLDLQPPATLPDNLRGEQWNFVQLPLSALQQELRQVQSREIFGDLFDLEASGFSDLTAMAPIPGVAVYSKRAEALAAWTNGLELAALTADVDRACLILETGVNQRWRYGGYRRSPETTGEAKEWENAKKNNRGLHFLAIQSDAEAEQCEGLWLLQDKELPTI